MKDFFKNLWYAIKKVLSSRTIWVLLFTAFFNAWQVSEAALEPGVYVFVNSLLLAIASYFRIDARVNFRE